MEKMIELAIWLSAESRSSKTALGSHLHNMEH